MPLRIAIQWVWHSHAPGSDYTYFQAIRDQSRIVFVDLGQRYCFYAIFFLDCIWQYLDIIILIVCFT
ncbi:unnamed protein product [Ciceribacter sp. T2.26MG-112.2]|nr:unnamed protein product [Ciceribacter naphthalenivorans]